MRVQVPVQRREPVQAREPVRQREQGQQEPVRQREQGLRRAQVQVLVLQQEPVRLRAREPNLRREPDPGQRQQRSKASDLQMQTRIY